MTIYSAGHREEAQIKTKKNVEECWSVRLSQQNAARVAKSAENQPDLRKEIRTIKKFFAK